MVAAVMRSWVAVLLAEPSTRMPEPQPRLTYGLVDKSARRLRQGEPA